MKLAEQLAAGILSGDAEQCHRLLASLSEEERQELRPVVIQTVQELRSSNGGRIQEAACLALHWTGSLTEIKKNVSWISHGPMFAEALAARRPAWLNQWVSWALQEMPSSWPTVRNLVRVGCCDRPEQDPNYYLRMIPPTRSNVALLLESDPELLEHEVWRLFEIEGRSDVSLAQNDKYARVEGRWADTLARLAGEGRIDRGRLLLTSLRALQRGFPQFQAGWFSRFHELLQPTAEERAALVDEYLHLLASTIAPTVAFAVRALSAIEKASLLDGGLVLRAVTPALYAREKNTGTALLKLMASIAVREPGLRDRAAEFACVLAESPAAELQEKVIEFVRKNSRPEHLPARLEQLSQVVAASVRKARLGAVAHVAPMPPREERDEAAPVKWQTLAGIRADGSLGPLNLDHPDIPRLHAGNRIEPIESIEDLVDASLRVLEAGGPPDGVERVLDGIARLCVERPDGFDRLVSPLLKRAKKIAGSPPANGVSRLIAGLVLCWISKEPWQNRLKTEGAPEFLQKRCEALAARVVDGCNRPLRSAPTHSGGWIEGSAWNLRQSTFAPTDPCDDALAAVRAGQSACPEWLQERIRQPDFIPWVSTLAPAHRQVWFELGRREIADNLDWWEAHWQNKQYLEALLEQDTPLGEKGSLLLMLGLAAKEEGEGTLAADALAAAIADGRIGSEELCRGLELVLTLKFGTFAPKPATPRRVLKRLTQVRLTSGLHAVVIREALRPLIAGPAKAFARLFKDLCVETEGCDLTSELRGARLRRAARWAASNPVGHV